MFPWDNASRYGEIFRVDFLRAFLYNKYREENRQPRGQAERLSMRKVRAPQGKDNG
jgi:hypothetical protein